MQAADPLCDLQFEMVSFYTACMEIAAYFFQFVWQNTCLFVYQIRGICICIFKICLSVSFSFLGVLRKKKWKKKKKKD